MEHCRAMVLHGVRGLEQLFLLCFNYIPSHGVQVCGCYFRNKRCLQTGNVMHRLPCIICKASAFCTIVCKLHNPVAMHNHHTFNLYIRTLNICVYILAPSLSSQCMTVNDCCAMIEYYKCRL